MSDKNDNDEDFTRIEDLEEFHHEEDAIPIPQEQLDEYNNLKNEQKDVGAVFEDSSNEYENVKNDEEAFEFKEDIENETSDDKKEDFSDLKTYGEAISPETEKILGPNPPYSLILKNISYIEDAKVIKQILTEYVLMTKDNKALIEEGLNNNTLLIPQINEYTALSLIHRLRELDLEIIFGLSEELHPSKIYDQNAKGLISKKNIYQNVKKNVSLEHSCVVPNEIVVTTTSNLDGRHIQRYFGVISEHAVVTIAQIKLLSEEEKIQKFQVIYDGLLEKLKIQADKLHANGIVGIQYQVIPLEEPSSQEEIQYKITCTGNAVWIVDAK